MNLLPMASKLSTRSVDLLQVLSSTIPKFKDAGKLIGRSTNSPCKSSILKSRELNQISIPKTTLLLSQVPSGMVVDISRASIHELIP
jgi:hypothetical protein